MQAVVAVPPLRDFYFTPHRFANLGAEVVLRILRQQQINATLLNFPLSGKAGPIALDPTLEYLRPYLLPRETGGLAFFRQYRRYGPPVSECAQSIQKLHPDIVFISCFAFAYADDALELAAELKKYMPQIPIVAGGVGVSSYPDYFLSTGKIDFCLAGEAEMTLTPFLRIFLAGGKDEQLYDLPGLHFRHGRVRSMNKWPYTSGADLDFILKLTWETRQAAYYSTSLSRGCSKRCRFCSLFLCHGRSFRTVPVYRVEAGLAECAARISAGGKKIRINFEDDNLLLDPDYFSSILGLFRRHLPQAAFYAENGLDCSLLSKEMLKTLICFGFAQFNLSLVSIDERILSSQGRRLDPGSYGRLLQMIRCYGLDCITYFICGLGDDTASSLARTLAFLAGLPTTVGISFFYAVPGIKDFKNLSLFHSRPAALCKGSAAFPWYGSLSTQTMITAFRLSRFINLLKSARTSAEKALVRLVIGEKKLYTLIKTKNGPVPEPVEPLDASLVSRFFKLLSL